MATTGRNRAERRLAAILVADVVGYSRLIGADEQGTLSRLRAIRSQIVDPKIAEHRGRLVKTTGDGLLVEFASVVDALRCASEWQEATKADDGIAWRIGINVGDVVVEDGDIFGDGVNVAARLEALAEPGGICVSARVQEDAAGRLDLAFEDIGAQELKNIARPVHVYRVAAPKGPSAPRNSTTSLPLPDKPSIAVLPFENMSGDPEQDYFADGMVEEIITALSRIRWLFVIARNSAFTYKGQAVDLKQVGRELGVRYVLEGSVRKGGNRVRITAQLIEAETGAHLWADRFDGSMEDVFDLQDQVATNVAGVIEPALHAAETLRARARPTSDLTAYDLYLRGADPALEWSKEATLQGLDFLNQAITRDPRFGAALAAAAFSHSLLYCSGWADDPEATKREGVSLAHRALQYGGDDTTTMSAAAVALMNFDEDATPLVGVTERALSLNPGSFQAWLCSGWVRVAAGDPARALEHFATCERLDPRSPYRPTILTGIGIAHFIAHRLDEAVANWLSAIPLLPSYVTPYYYLASCYAHMGRLDDAKEMFGRLSVLTPPKAHPPVVITQNPEERAFFFTGYRRAMGLSG